MHNVWGRWLKHGQWNTVVSKVRFIDGNHITLLSVWIKRNRNQMEDIVDIVRKVRKKRSESYQSHFDRLSSEKYCQFQHLQASIRLHPLPLVLSCAVPWFGTLDLDHITDCCHGGGGRTGAECQVGTEPAPKTNSIQIPFSMLKKWEHQKTVKKICVKHFKPHFECKTTWDLAAGAVSLS